MDTSSQEVQRSRLWWIWPVLLGAFGLFRLGEWVYSGRQDLASLLSGLGFLLMVPGAPFIAVAREKLKSQRHYRARLALAWLGLALVIAGMGGRWL